MRTDNKRAVVLWTGGKDCNLALHEAKKKGYEMIALITFAMGDARFLAHPIQVMKQQARALNIPHVIVPVNEPYKKSYEEAIAAIKIMFEIETIVTGDIAEIHGNTNWITDRSAPSGVDVYLPLWHLEREQILQKLLDLDFKTIFSCVKEPWFTTEWLGKSLTAETLDGLKKLRQVNGVDMCGEQGEYHTLVLDGPEYNYELNIGSFTAKKDNTIMYMEIENITLHKKQSA
jgi:diphthine-ammonia ligase